MVLSAPRGSRPDDTDSRDHLRHPTSAGCSSGRSLVSSILQGGCAGTGDAMTSTGVVSEGWGQL